MTGLPKTTDVLIAGAGPTGLSLAATLCAAGVECCVIDGVEEGGNYSRAVGTLPRSLEMLQRIQVGERLAEAGNHAERIRIFSGERDRNIATLRLDRLDTAFPYAVLLPQHTTEEIILARLRELGGGVHRPLKLSGMEQADDEVVAVVADAGGEEHTVRAKYLVGADGTRSDVRRMAGIPFPGETFHQRFVLADMELGGGSPADEIHLFFARPGAVIMGRMPGRLHRVCLSVDRLPDEMTAAAAEALLRQRAPAQRAVRVLRVAHDSHTRIHHRVAERFRVGRVFLAGDAAHVNSPIIGQGMNLGIQDGITLGEVLVKAMNRAEDALDSYERVRRPIAEDAVGATRRLNALATERAPWKGALRDMVLPLTAIPSVNRKMIYRLSRLVDR
ncbi:FAD-dependent monooxygenase [Actinomadura sp. NPDC049382]|uniref:FAD-dependent oxidoreductase n=1 Tax=Actinomadura sp. NPDC049382 TaxID=3158220 RepID=UPI0034249C2B